jgi:hypothetical protein
LKLHLLQHLVGFQFQRTGSKRRFENAVHVFALARLTGVRNAARKSDDYARSAWSSAVDETQS